MKAMPLPYHYKNQFIKEIIEMLVLQTINDGYINESSEYLKDFWIDMNVEIENCWVRITVPLADNLGFQRVTKFPFNPNLLEEV